MDTSNMKYVLLLILVVFSVSCNEKGEQIQYKEAEGYFVLNSVKNEGAYDKKITTKEEFDKYFGMAATMASSPTVIDFDKEFVAAYILPVSNMETKITVDSVVWTGKQAEMWLSIETGDSLSYSIRPFKMLLIDKKYDENVTSFVTSYKTKQ